ncbi:MAG: hypothetical protein ACRC62_26200 [Microcoleus sp.]
MAIDSQLLIDRLSTINYQLSTFNFQLRGRARGHRPYQLSTSSGGHGGTAPTNSQLSTLNSQLSTLLL